MKRKTGEEHIKGNAHQRRKWKRRNLTRKLVEPTSTKKKQKKKR